MSNGNPYGGSYPGPQGQPSGPQGQPNGPYGQPSGPQGQPSGPYGQPSAPQGPPNQGGYGYPPAAGGGAAGSGYGFGPYAGGPAGPPPPGGPGGPGGPYGPPPGGYQPPPGGQPPKKNGGKIALIAGGAALVLIAGTTGVVLANRDDPGATPTTSTTAVRTPGGQSTDPGGGPTTEPPTSQPPAGAKPSDAVNGFLQALASGDANAALSYSAEPVDKGGTLSSSVLAQSIKRAPLTEINVPEVASGTSVQATYRLGTKAVSESFDVVKVGDNWKLRQVVADLNLSSVRTSGLTTRLNGAKVTRSTVSVFPGSYVLSTGSKVLTFSKGSLLVRGPSDLVSTSGVRLKLSSSGVSTAKRATKRSYSKCLKARSTTPKNCPFGLTTGRFKVNKSTIRWTEKGGNPFRSSKVRLVGTYARVSMKLNVQMNASCSDSGRAATCSGDVKRTVYGYVSGVKPSRTVRWSTF